MGCSSSAPVVVEQQTPSSPQKTSPNLKNSDDLELESYNSSSDDDECGLTGLSSRNELPGLILTPSGVSIEVKYGWKPNPTLPQPGHMPFLMGLRPPSPCWHSAGHALDAHPRRRGICASVSIKVALTAFAALSHILCAGMATRDKTLPQMRKLNLPATLQSTGQGDRP